MPGGRQRPVPLGAMPVSVLERVAVTYWAFDVRFGSLADIFGTVGKCPLYP